jgi:hypothetical protein
MSNGDRFGKAPIILGAVGAFVVVALGGVFLARPGDARVSGKVTVDGEPVAGAQVIFIGEDENNQAPLVATTGEGGTYCLIGNKGGGIPPGKYKVAVTRMALKDRTVPTGEKLEQARSKGLLLNVLPKVYEHRSTTPLSFDVPPGHRTIDLALRKRP